MISVLSWFVGMSVAIFYMLSGIIFALEFDKKYKDFGDSGFLFGMFWPISLVIILMFKILNWLWKYIFKIL